MSQVPAIPNPSEVTPPPLPAPLTVTEQQAEKSVEALVAENQALMQRITDLQEELKVANAGLVVAGNGPAPSVAAMKAARAAALLKPAV